MRCVRGLWGKVCLVVAWQLQGDFTVILKTLQRYPPVDINVLLQRAAEMPPCRTILGAEV